MINFLYLIPIALAMGAIGLIAFLWSLRSGQYEDLDGASERILFNDDDTPAATRPHPAQRQGSITPAPPESRASATNVSDNH